MKAQLSKDYSLNSESGFRLSLKEIFNNRYVAGFGSIIKLFSLFFVLFFIAVPKSASAATIYWTGATSSSWSLGTNWSNLLGPSTGDIVNIGNGNSFTNQPIISVSPSAIPATINIGSTKAVTLTINSGITLGVGTLNITGTGANAGAVAVNGTLNVDNISMNNYSTITVASTGILQLSAAIAGGTLNATASGATVKLDGTTAAQSFPGTTNLTSNDVSYLDIANTYNGSSTDRGVTLSTNTNFDRLTVENNSIFDANGSLVKNTGYYLTMKTNADYISKTTFTFDANDVIDPSSTLEFSANSQSIYLYKANAGATNLCPNVKFTGTTVNVYGGPQPYSATNVNNNSTFLVRGTLDITSTNSNVKYQGITLIDINGDFTGVNALTPGTIPVNLAGSWTNTDTDNLMGIVTYDGTTSTSTQTVATNVTYGNNLVFTGASPKKVASGTLEVDGSTLDNSAGSSVDFVTNKTTTLLNSTAAQTIKGGTATSSICTPDIVTGTIFYNLTLSNGANTTTLNGNNNIAPNGTLTLLDANSKLDASASGTTFTLMSSAAGTASVAALPTGATITGSSINVQRYFKAQSTAGYKADYTRNYRLLSSPVNANGILSNTGSTAYGTLTFLNSNSGLISGVFTGGPGGTSSGFTVANATPTIYLYKESLTASNTAFNSGNFKGITNITGGSLTVYNDAGTTANVSATLYAGNGYMLYYVGDNVSNTSSSSPNSGGYNKSTRVGGYYAAVDDATTTAVGTLNQGSIPVKIWWNSSTTLGNVKTGFNLVGNPYASSIDWDKFSASTSTAGIYGPNLSTSIYVYNYKNKNYGVYQTGIGGTGTNNATNVIASGQGFFVQVKSSSGSTLTFNEAAKTSSQPTGTPLLLNARPQLASVTGTSTVPQLLRMRLASDSVNYDESIIRFDQGASNGYEAYIDAPRMAGMGNYTTLASYAKGSNLQLSINHMAAIDSTTRVKLYVNISGTSGVDTLAASGLASLDSRYDAYLIDHYKKDSLLLSQYPKYLFNIYAADTASFGANRFEIVFHKNAAVANFHLLSFTGATASGNPLLNWKTDHEANYTGFALQRLDVSTGQYATINQSQSNGSGSYSYTDKTAAKGANNYRLQITDAFGNITYSSVVTVVLGDNAAATSNEGILVAVYPNPAASNIRVSVAEGEQSQQLLTTTANANASAGNLQVNILSMNGQVVGRFLGSSTNIASGDISALKPGTYILEASDSQGKKVYGRKRFVKL